VGNSNTAGVVAPIEIRITARLPNLTVSCVLGSQGRFRHKGVARAGFQHRRVLFITPVTMHTGSRACVGSSEWLYLYSTFFSYSVRRDFLRVVRHVH
jgi:hypothetical protein